MEKLYYPTLKETLFHEKLENGLQVYLLEKKDFYKTYGLFSTRFGSVDTQFVPLNQEEVYRAQDGVAHFLEHKMFEMEHGEDAMNAFAKLGASTNAFTSSSRTAYLFNTTSHVDECCELLLDFVQTLHIDDASVDKEKGIICQEIRMYEDDPDWRCYFGSIQNLYQNHPVAIDIAGSVESVQATTKDMLQTVYETFYHPSNMMLFVVGNFEASHLMDVIRRNQNQKTFAPAAMIKRSFNKEPQDIKKKEEVLTMDVTLPKVMLATKINTILEDPKEKLKRELAMNIFLEMFFSKSSSLYHQWLKKGLINDSFGYSFTQERDYAFIQLGCDTESVEGFIGAVKDFYQHIHQQKIDEQDFQRILKRNIGSLIESFNSPETIANLFSRYYFEGIHAFDIVDEFKHITCQDIEDMKKYFELNLTTTFVVEKNK